jgi:hypothetical protein
MGERGAFANGASDFSTRSTASFTAKGGDQNSYEIVEV